MLMAGMSGNNSTTTQVVTTSKTQIPVPKIQKGMSFEDYKDLVEKWECMTDLPDHKKAMMLTMELPLNDAHGGLQRAVRNKFKNEELMVNDGVKIVIDFLSTILEEQSFVRLRGWMHRGETFCQKPSWSIERYLTEFHSLVSEAKTQFKHDIVYIHSCTVQSIETYEWLHRDTRGSRWNAHIYVRHYGTGFSRQNRKGCSVFCVKQESNGNKTRRKQYKLSLIHI